MWNKVKLYKWFKSNRLTRAINKLRAQEKMLVEQFLIYKHKMMGGTSSFINNILFYKYFYLSLLAPLPLPFLTIPLHLAVSLSYSDFFISYLLPSSFSTPFRSLFYLPFQVFLIDQKQRRVGDSEANLELFWNNPKEFLRPFVAMDETYGSTNIRRSPINSRRHG